MDGRFEESRCTRRRTNKNVNDSKLFEREDVDFSKTIDQEEILLNAPKKNGNFFTVPKVIE